MKTIKYYISTWDNGIWEFTETEGKEFMYKDLRFGLKKVVLTNGKPICAVTELSTGLKINCTMYNPRTYKEVVELFTEDFYQLVKKVLPLQQEVIDLLKERQNNE